LRRSYVSALSVMQWIASCSCSQVSSHHIRSAFSASLRLSMIARSNLEALFFSSRTRSVRHWASGLMSVTKRAVIMSNPLESWWAMQFWFSFVTRTLAVFGHWLKRLVDERHVTLRYVKAQRQISYIMRFHFKYKIRWVITVPQSCGFHREAKRNTEQVTRWRLWATWWNHSFIFDNSVNIYRI